MNYLNMLNNQLKNSNGWNFNKIFRASTKLYDKSKAMKFILKKHFLIISNGGNVLHQLKKNAANKSEVSEKLNKIG